MLDKYEAEIKHYKDLRISYEISIMDPHLTKMLEKFYIVHIKLMKDWGEYQENQAQFGSSPQLFCHMPEGML